MIYDRKNKYLLSVTITIENNNGMWQEEEITNRFLGDLKYCNVFAPNYDKEPWNNPSMGVFDRITLKRKSEYVKGLNLDFTKPMEIADKSFKQNNLELKKTNTQVIENLSPNSKEQPAIAYTVNSGGPSDEEEKMYQEILKEKEAEEKKRAKRKTKSERNKYATTSKEQANAQDPKKDPNGP